MNRAEAEKLLGGHATGTLTEAERSLLFAAALAHQEVFDALADQEGLRELLADPGVRAQLLAALAPAPPKVVPLWRRPGLLAAAASLLVGTTAGLVYLRSPEAGRVPALQEAPKATPKPVAAPATAQAPAQAPVPEKAPARPALAPKAVPPPPAPVPAPAPAADLAPRPLALAVEAPSARREAAAVGSVGGVVASAPPAAALKAKRDAQPEEQAARRNQARTGPSLRIRAFSGLTGTSDPRDLRRELEDRLQEPALAATLAELPAGTTLALKVDASGQVLAATFDRAFPGAAKAQELLGARRLQTWTGGLAGSLELTLGWER